MSTSNARLSQFKCIDYEKTLLNCVLLADIIYEENPKASLESSGIQHDIQKLVSTVKIQKDEFFESYSELKYMICLNDDIKQVIVVFCETEQMDDYLSNFDPYGFIDDCEDCIHSTIFRQSIQIPIDYFMKKILEDYQVVFTGHGLGGAIASITATHCLRCDGVKGDKKRESQVLSIAFGTPPFVTNEFKTLIESKYELKDCYHFYFNPNDLVVQLFDFLLNSLTADPKPKLLSNKKDAVEKLKSLVNDIINSRDASKHSDLLKSLNKVPTNPKFVFFGSLFDSAKAPRTQITIKNLIIDVKLQESQVNTMARYVYSLYRSAKAAFVSTVETFDFDVKLLGGLVNSHNMKTYFQDIHTANLNNLIKPSCLEITQLMDLNVPIITECSLEEFQKANTNNAFVVKFIVNEFKTDIIISIACQNIEFIRSCASIKIKNENNEKIEFKGRYPEQSLDKKIFSLIFSLSNKNFNNIEEKIECANPENFQDKTFECNLIAHFNTCEISFSTEKKMFIKGLSVKKKHIENMPLDILYIYGIFFVNVMDKVDDAQLRDRSNDLKKVFIELDNKLVEGKLEGNSHWCNNKFLKKVLKAKLREHFGDLVKDLLDEDDEDKKGGKQLFNEKYVSLKKYLNNIMFSNEENNLIEDKGKDRLEEFFRNIFPTCHELAIFQAKSSFVRDVKKVYFERPRDLIMEKTFSSKLYFLTLYQIELALSTYIYIPLCFLVQEFTYKVSLRDYIKNLPDNSDIGYLEIEIKKSIESGSLKNDLNDVFLQTILLNRKIRDLLSQDILIGVVGKKKKGKSTFVKEITGINTNPDSNITTYKMNVCRLTDSIKIIDYPDCEKANHRIQFTLSRYLLDHVFMVCAAIDGEAEANKKLINSIKGACEKNFTVILNRIDDNLDKCEFNLDSGRDIINKIMFNFEKEFETKNLLVTYLDNNKKTKMLDFVEKLELLTSKKLKLVVYYIIHCQIPKDAKIVQQGLEALAKSAIDDNLVKYKRITIQNEKGTKSDEYIVTKDKSCIPENEKDEEITFESFEQLQEEVKNTNRLNKLPNFYSNGDYSKIIEDIQGLLDTNGIIFVAKI